MKHHIKVFDAIPARLVVGVMLFFACCINYMFRVNMSLNLIAMVPAKPNATSIKSECEAFTGNQSAFRSDSGSEYLQSKWKAEDSLTFDWSAQQQATILSGFFWGYFVTGLFGGLLTELCGPRNLVFGTILLSAVLTFFSSQIAQFHYVAFVINRIVIGLAAGAHFPAFHALVAHWAPPDEKGKFVSGLVGGAIGTVATWSLSGPLINSYGWEVAFYVAGLIGLVFCVLWWFLVYDSPLVHPRISEEEKLYILDALGDKLDHRKAKLAVPLKSIMTSWPFLAMVILHYGSTWGFYFALTAAPQYVSTALGYKLSATGFLSSLPYLARQTCSLGFGSLGDLIARKRWMTTNVMRKFFCISSHIIPGLLLCSLSYAGCTPLLSIAIITSTLGFNGAATLTNLVNCHDLAPNFASTIYGIANAVGTLAGLITPYVTAYFTKDGNGIAEWRPVFLVGGSVYMVTGIYFIIFGTSETQKWNQINDKNELKVDKEKN